MLGRLTLCICTMNRPDELDTALASVRQGTRQPFEVIVSDDGDGSAEAVALRYGAMYQAGPRRGLGPNRNAAIRSASGDAVAFIDDDVKVSSQFIEIASKVAGLEQVTTGWELNYRTGVGVKVTPQNPDFMGFQRLPPHGDYKGVVINATVFPISLFERAKFDERIKYGYEEIDMARQARQIGYPIAFDDSLWVEHLPSPVNRDSYSDKLAASRLYVTHRAYREYERNPVKAAAFLAVAVPHHLAHAVKSGVGIAAGVSTIRRAQGYWRAAREESRAS